MDDGIDFYFDHINKCRRFVDFIGAVIPVKVAETKQLVSFDEQNNVHNVKHSVSVEITPICKEDLVCLPPKVAKKYGNVCPVVLCVRAASSLRFVDPIALQHIAINGDGYWRAPFHAVASSKDLVLFVVLNTEPVDDSSYDAAAPHVHVEVARASDFGRNDTTFFTRSHLGYILKPGDHAYGYDISALNVNHDDFMKFMDGDVDVPDVYLVKKAYPNRRRRRKIRHWRLKHLVMDDPDERVRERDRAEIVSGKRGGEGGGGGGKGGGGEGEDEDDAMDDGSSGKKRRAGGRKARRAKNRKGGGKKGKKGERGVIHMYDEEEYEAFLQDIEEDPEGRAEINLYALPSAMEKKKKEKKTKRRTEEKKGNYFAALGEEDEDDDEKEEKKEGKGKVENENGGTEEEEEEEDFPEIQLHELLQDLSLNENDEQ